MAEMQTIFIKELFQLSLVISPQKLMLRNGTLATLTYLGVQVTMSWRREAISTIRPVY
ncbi:MAG: hypothetical protein GAK37_03439 [Pseudomonas sp.]|nr:MAG: hypothetical protein GAK37_03439 [Pseudomonas sp.]